jgi:hypothetical protein
LWCRNALVATALLDKSRTSTMISGLRRRSRLGGEFVEERNGGKRGGESRGGVKSECFAVKCKLWRSSYI